MRKLYTLALFVVLPGATAAAQQPPPPTQPATQAQPQQQPAATPNPHAGHEYAPLVERELDYKDWTFKTYPAGEPVNLREWARGKRLVLVAYFAPWCGNWRMERPVLARLHEKYKAHGFDVIAVSNYATPDELKNHFDPRPATYTVVVESDARDAREKTDHFKYRQRTGDTRKWGSPYNVFLAPAKLRASGDVLAERVWVVGGELIEAEVEQFIREQLGLPKEGETKAAAKP
ncbi:MAG TPA: TlpA disulfide reductase family protein [Pyrinomonadaceae bacterium]|nr:TlpA disulfide reductase family protein [Pyrinomonadaceae bacterium]